MKKDSLGNLSMKFKRYTIKIVDTVQRQTKTVNETKMSKKKEW